jgi:hypothetical protein
MNHLPERSGSVHTALSVCTYVHVYCDSENKTAIFSSNERQAVDRFMDALRALLEIATGSVSVTEVNVFTLVLPSQDGRLRPTANGGSPHDTSVSVASLG